MPGERGPEGSPEQNRFKEEYTNPELFDWLVTNAKQHQHFDLANILQAEKDSGRFSLRSRGKQVDREMTKVLSALSMFQLILVPEVRGRDSLGVTGGFISWEELRETRSQIQETERAKEVVYDVLDINSDRQAALPTIVGPNNVAYRFATRYGFVVEEQYLTRLDGSHSMIGRAEWYPPELRAGRHAPFGQIEDTEPPNTERDQPET